MKKTDLLNSHISYAISQMGHYDSIVIADAGLPIPSGPERIDIALMKDVPSFQQSVRAVLSELFVQKAYIALEMKEANFDAYEFVKNEIGNLGIPVEEISHEEFKARLKYSKAIIRTGECKPYANIIFESGVVF